MRERGAYVASEGDPSCIHVLFFFGLLHDEIFRLDFINVRFYFLLFLIGILVVVY